MAGGPTQDERLLSDECAHCPVLSRNRELQQRLTAALEEAAQSAGVAALALEIAAPDGLRHVEEEKPPRRRRGGIE